MHTGRKAMFRAAVLITGYLGAAASPARAADWDWILTPYLWGSSMKVDVFVKDEPVFGQDLSFSDLIDNLHVGFQLHFEGRRSKAGFFLDLTYLSVSDSETTPANPPLPGGTVLDADVDTTLFEAAGFYRPSGEALGLDLLLGIRVMDLKMELDITPPAPLPSTRIDGSGTFTDAFAGLRYSFPLGQRWILAVRGDAGAGDSDLTWNVSGLFAFHFGKDDRYNALIGYRHMEIEVEETSGAITVKTELTMSGPMTGFAFRF